MEFYEREFLIARITCGYLLFDVNDSLTIRIKSLTKDQNYKAQIVFKKAYEEALVEGVMCPIESKEMLEQQGIWGEEQTRELEKLKKKLKS